MVRHPIRALLALTLLLVTALPVLSAEPTVNETDRAAIAAVIQRQSQAFKRDDATEAFGYASSNIQAMFGTADRFLSMVRSQYAPVYRPQSFTLTELVERDGALIQLVSIVGPDGEPVTAAYVMERQPDGSWRIGGCYLLKPGGQTV